MELEQEHKLIVQAATDPQAFGRLYDAHYEPILNYALRRVSDPEAALDITAVTFLKAWESLRAGKYRWQGVPFAAWLYRIAGNELNSYYRRQRRRTLSLDALYEASGLEPVGDYDLEADLVEWQRQAALHESFVLIRTLLAELPPKYQEVLALRFFEKKPLADIALITGKKVNTVKSLLKRGTEKLRAEYARSSGRAPEAATFVRPLRYNKWRKQP